MVIEKPEGCPSWLWQAELLIRAGDEAGGLNVIHGCIYNLLQDGRSQAVDETLQRLPVAEFTTDTLVNLLSATFPTSWELPARQNFYDRVEEHLRPELELAPSLLKGLFEKGHHNA